MANVLLERGLTESVLNFDISGSYGISFDFLGLDCSVDTLLPQIPK